MNKLTTRTQIHWALLLAMLFLTGCSGFRKDWKRAEAIPVVEGSLAGRWEGSWVSDSNGHHGRLRCIMTETGDGEYLAQFHAKYKRILSFAYDVPFQAKKEGAGFRFTGEADLGKLAGGIYTYEGNTSNTNFFSTYRCRHDHGTFQMTRPE